MAVRSYSILSSYNLLVLSFSYRHIISLLQDIAGAVGESSKKGAVAPPTTPRRSDGLHPQGLSVTEQGEAEEGDVSRKDQVIWLLND